MTDGQHDWEFQLPEIATAYEVKVPLSGKPASPMSIDMAAVTAADREIMADNQAPSAPRRRPAIPTTRRRGRRPVDAGRKAARAADARRRATPAQGNPAPTPAGAPRRATC